MIRIPVGLLIFMRDTANVRDPVALLRFLVWDVPSANHNTVIADPAVLRHMRIAIQLGVKQENQ